MFLFKTRDKVKTFITFQIKRDLLSTLIVVSGLGDFTSKKKVVSQHRVILLYIS